MRRGTSEWVWESGSDSLKQVKQANEVVSWSLNVWLNEWASDCISKWLSDLAINMKNTVFWDVAPCRYSINRRFGGTYRLHLQDRRNKKKKPGPRNQREKSAATCSLWFLGLGFFFLLSSILNMEAIYSSGTSVYTISIGCAIAQAVSRWFPTAAARVQTRVW
jgi:hypothetical protein